MRMLLPVFRGFLRSPGFTLVAVLTLALGIGASTAMFNVIHSTLLRPLPYDAAEDLVRFRDLYAPTGGSGGVTTANFVDLREEARSLSGMAGFSLASFNVVGGDRPERAGGLRVTHDFLETLGVQPVLGRGFAQGEDRQGRPDVVVITHPMWQTRFSGSRDVIGGTLLIDARPHEVIGVLPEGFWFPGDPAVIVPFDWSPEQLQDRGSRWLEGLARLAPGTTLEQADAELKTLFAGLAESYPQQNADWSIWTAPFGEWALDSNRTSLILLNGAALLLLLIGGVNVANLMLVRTERGARDMAVRVALGATRRQIVTRHVAEGLVLGALSAVVGVMISIAASRGLLLVYGGSLPRAGDVALTLPTLGYAALLALAAGLLIGLLPLLRTRSEQIFGMLREGGRGGGARGNRLQRFLVAGEVAVAVLLVSGAGLLIHSFWRLNTVDPGIVVDNALVFTVHLPVDGYDSPDATERFFERALEQIQAVPGVRHAGISERTPLQGGYNITTLPSPDDPEVSASFVEIRTITPDFFAAAGIPLLAGRGLDADDVRAGRDVVVISDILAATLFGSDDPIGRRILPEWNDGGYEIVGVVGSVREFGITGGRRPSVYWPLQKIGQRNNMVFVVRTEGNPLRAMPGIRRGIAEIDPTLPIYGVRTLGDVVVETVGARWLATRLFTVFGALALVLSAVGIFGVLAFVVEQRTREIGIRTALGATPSAVRRMIVGQGLRLVAWGLIFGLGGAIYASRFLSDLLWEVEPADPRILVTVAGVVLVTAMFASYLPALRATRIQPQAALAQE